MSRRKKLAPLPAEILEPGTGKKLFLVCEPHMVYSTFLGSFCHVCSQLQRERAYQEQRLASLSPGFPKL